MKLTKFAALVKRDGCCNVYHIQNSDVWLGTRNAIYRADGLPDIQGRQEAQAILSFNEKQMEKIVLNEYHCDSIFCVNGMNLRDYDCGEKDTRPTTDIGLVHAAVNSDDGELLFYDTKYLSPILDTLKDKEYMEITIRRSLSGAPYIAIKDGFNILAVIMPMKIIDDVFLSNLQEFQALCTEQYFRESGKEKV